MWLKIPSLLDSENGEMHSRTMDCPNPTIAREQEQMGLWHIVHCFGQYRRYKPPNMSGTPFGSYLGIMLLYVQSSSKAAAGLENSSLY